MQQQVLQHRSMKSETQHHLAVAVAGTVPPFQAFQVLESLARAWAHFLSVLPTSMSVGEPALPGHPSDVALTDIPVCLTFPDSWNLMAVEMLSCRLEMPCLAQHRLSDLDTELVQCGEADRGHQGKGEVQVSLMRRVEVHRGSSFQMQTFDLLLTRPWVRVTASRPYISLTARLWASQQWKACRETSLPQDCLVVHGYSW